MLNRNMAEHSIFSTHTRTYHCSISCPSNRWARVQWMTWTRLDLSMDALVLQHGRIHYSWWTRPPKSLDASSLNCVCVHQKLAASSFCCGRAWNFWKTRLTRLHCVHKIFGRVQRGNVCIIGTVAGSTLRSRARSKTANLQPKENKHA